MNFNQFEIGVMAPTSRRKAPKLKEMIVEKSVHFKAF